MSILKGTIYITDKEEVIYNIPLDGSTRIINLDEDGILMEHDLIIGGTCLLPPIEAKIAEADGNEQLYDTIYSNPLLEPFQQRFIGALMAYLYRGGNLVLFLPELGYNNTRNKLVQHMFIKYGIHIGIIGDQNPQNANCYYDDRCIPIWMNMIYASKTISPYEYLYMYPIDAPLENRSVINDLINDIKPYCKTYNEKIQYVLDFHKKIHQNSKLRPAITSI